MLVDADEKVFAREASLHFLLRRRHDDGIGALHEQSFDGAAARQGALLAAENRADALEAAADNLEDRAEAVRDQGEKQGEAVDDADVNAAAMSNEQKAALVNGSAALR